MNRNFQDRGVLKELALQTAERSIAPLRPAQIGADGQIPQEQRRQLDDRTKSVCALAANIFQQYEAAIPSPEFGAAVIEKEWD